MLKIISNDQGELSKITSLINPYYVELFSPGTEQNNHAIFT